jgi:hypothetical protein
MNDLILPSPINALLQTFGGEQQLFIIRMRSHQSSVRNLHFIQPVGQVDVFVVPQNFGGQVIYGEGTASTFESTTPIEIFTESNLNYLLYVPCPSRALQKFRSVLGF